MWKIRRGGDGSLRGADNTGQSDGLKVRLVKGSIGSLSFRVISTGLGFLVSFALARLLGADGLGIYAYAIAWVMFLSAFSALGLRSLIVREISVYRAHANWGHIRGLLRTSNRAVLVASLALMAIAALLSWVFSEGGQKLYAFWLALLILPLTSLTVVRQAAMHGFMRVVLCEAPETLVRPMVFLASIAVVHFFTDMKISALSALSLNIAAACVAFGVGAYMLRRIVPAEVGKAAPVTEFSLWARSALPMLFIGGMQIINHQADIILLGIFKSPEQVGVYAIAVRLAGLVAFILIAAEFAVAPMVAELYAKKEMERLQRLMTQAARLIIFVSLPAALFLIVYGEFVLGIFGKEFISGKLPLTILCAGQLINAFFGAIGRLALMTGHERATSLIVAAAAVVNIALNIALIPEYGAVGAAVATAVSMAMWNLGVSAYLYSKIRILSTPFGASR